MREHHFPEAPTVVQCDGIWVTIQEQEAEIKLDKRHRHRHKRRGKKVVILVAMGFWPDGRREILDWQVATSEEHTEWEVLLKRLRVRGVEAEQGLKMIVRDGCGGLGKALANVYGTSILDQRCIFHKLRNVADKASLDLKGKDQRQAKNELIKQAAHMYAAPQAEVARQRRSSWAQQWRPQAPEAVATLERDFEDTLLYYQLDTLTCEWIRTTSLLERTNRELRRKFRQALTFGSTLGVNVAVFLQVQRLHARLS